jgi:hypothetical protein
MQQNTPRSTQDTRAATSTTAQNMRMSSSGAKVYQEGETALQSFWKKKIFPNKDSSSLPSFASAPPLPTPRTATAGALIRRPEGGNDRIVPMSTSHVQVRAHLLFTLLHCDFDVAAFPLVALLPFTRLCLHSVSTPGKTLKFCFLPFDLFFAPGTQPRCCRTLTCQGMS